MILKKYIKNNGLNETTLNMAKYRLENLDKQKNQKLLLLKCNGGVAKNPEMAEELFDLMFDTINARIELINEIDNKFNGGGSAEEDNDLGLIKNNKSNVNDEFNNNNNNNKKKDENLNNKNRIQNINSNVIYNDNKKIKENEEYEEVEEEIEEEVEEK